MKVRKRKYGSTETEVRKLEEKPPIGIQGIILTNGHLKSLNCVLKVGQDYINRCPNGYLKSPNQLLRVGQDYCPSGHINSIREAITNKDE